MAKGLYTRDEIACMTQDGLDELLGYYADTGNVEGMQRVMDEQETRHDDRMAEMEHEAEQERKQQLHDEMVNDMLIEDGRFG